MSGRLEVCAHFSAGVLNPNTQCNQMRTFGRSLSDSNRYLLVKKIKNLPPDRTMTPLIWSIEAILANEFCSNMNMGPSKLNTV